MLLPCLRVWFDWRFGCACLRMPSCQGTVLKFVFQETALYLIDDVAYILDPDDEGPAYVLVASSSAAQRRQLRQQQQQQQKQQRKQDQYGRRSGGGGGQAASATRRAQERWCDFGYARVLSMDLLELMIATRTDSMPALTVELSNQMLHITTCADSFETLTSMLGYYFSNGKSNA